MNNNIDHTQSFEVFNSSELSVKDIFKTVIDSLKEKGYDPINQIIGYMMSGDPTYITNYNGARSIIMKIERDELLEELINSYIKNRCWEN